MNHVVFFFSTGIDSKLDEENVGVLVLVTPATTRVTRKKLVGLCNDISSLSKKGKSLKWNGEHSKTLSSYFKWDIVEEVTVAAKNTSNAPFEYDDEADEKPEQHPLLHSEWYNSEKIAGDVVRLRRSSTLTMNSISNNNIPKMRKLEFFGILAKILPEFNPEYWNTVDRWNLDINIALFVIDVEDIPSGYYLLLRSSEVESLRKSMQSK